MSHAFSSVWKWQVLLRVSKFTVTSEVWHEIVLYYVRCQPHQQSFTGGWNPLFSDHPAVCLRGTVWA
jgi:hypothetical protein